MVFVSLSSKGQLTLPEGIRRKLGLGKGDTLAIEEKDGQIVLRPASVIPIATYSDVDIQSYVAEDSLTAQEKKNFDRLADKLKTKRPPGKKK